MKVKKDIFSNFLNKVNMNNTLTECIFNFEATGLTIKANNIDKVNRVSAVLKSSAFKEYEAIGEIGVNELKKIIDVIKRFGEYLTLKVEGNLLTVSSEGKKVDIELTAKEFITEDTGDPTGLEFTETFTLPMVKLKGIIADAQLNKDVEIIIQTTEKKALFSNSGKYKFQTTVEAPTCKGGTKSKYGQPLIEATAGLDGKLDISLSNNYPLKIMEKTDVSVVTLIIAPRVTDEE